MSDMASQIRAFMDEVRISTMLYYVSLWSPEPSAVESESEEVKEILARGHAELLKRFYSDPERPYNPEARLSERALHFQPLDIENYTRNVYMRGYKCGLAKHYKVSAGILFILSYVDYNRLCALYQQETGNHFIPYEEPVIGRGSNR